MPQSMSQASLPAFVINLEALSGILDKAEAFAAAKKFDPAVLLHSRLSPDMFDLAGQVQVATDQARRGAARLAGVEAPSFEDKETTIAQLKERIAKTVAFLKTLDKSKIDASADREIVFPLGPELYLSWADCSVRNNSDAEKTTVYRCELKPGYRF